MVEPRRAVEQNDDVTATVQDGELTSLVRRWMAAGTKVQERVRRESVLKVAPEPEPVAGVDVGPAPAEVVVEVADPEPAEVEAEGVEPEPEEAEPKGAGPAAATRSATPPLPRRSTGEETEQVHRVAVLIDARRVSADVATGLLARLGERGSVNVCRAYADWSHADLGDWARHMRREGLHSFHHFADDDEQALVAMTIDAVDIARDAAVDEVVIAGDLTSALPLVHRLHAAGVRVVAVGAAHTPHDVRAACHEFIDTRSIDASGTVAEGRHRA